jgi:cellulose synthase/poly-beta-1,6-N-acetylglucosamine synthase-like glycosyltransferase
MLIDKGVNEGLLHVIHEDVVRREGALPFPRPRAEGKFLWVGAEKFFVRGVTYGAFPPNDEGHQFPDDKEAAQDFAMMRLAGINTILTYTVPPRHLLDLAQAYGLRVIINVPWMGHVCFLEQASTQRDARVAVRNAVSLCRNHPAVLMYAVAKELPPQIVRWHGKRKIENFLRDLVYVAKDEDPEALVTYTNFPTTEYLELPFVDVQTFNVYLHQRQQFCSYLSRLQHLAGELPVVLTEFGMCSFRHGRDQQAEFLDWQIDEAIDHGFAGTVIFSWTDPFYQDGCLVDEWGFGLVDAERRPKPAYDTVCRRFSAAAPYAERGPWPRVSVVVALHNAERTLDECLTSLEQLDYPDYEIIVVNDGSTDGSQAIIDRHHVRSLTTAKGGVSAARNEGLRVATGEIVAYIDSDAFADPDWLRCLVRTFLESNAAGVGGPNLVPAADDWVAKCVFRSPGGPTQVMLDDQSAEHIPGCNMAFWKSALDEISGFDPIYTTAGDDVDVCWRLLERGHRLGFSPSALVWHHRRPSVRAFWRQQVGYGVAESLLERKHPNKFNRWGHASWRGTIYSPYPHFKLRRDSVIYQGLWGSAPFQSLYQTGGGGPLNYLPRAMEMHVILGVLVAVSLVFHWALVPFALGLAYILFYCSACALSADLSVLTRRPNRAPWAERLKWRSMIGWLHFLEPLARDWGRLKGGLTLWRPALPHEPGALMTSSWWQRLQPFRRTVKWHYPGDVRFEKHAMLTHLTHLFASRGCAVAWNPDFMPWDLRLRRGALAEASLRMVVEHLGGPRRVARFCAGIRPNRAISWTLCILALGSAAIAALEFHVPAAGLAGLLGVLWAASIREANRLEAGIRAATARVCTQPTVNDAPP